MFSQPRINDIASLYQGNPGALQQRIQKEQQAKPGLPPDLQKLLALQIITSEDDAMKREQALQQLQQTGQQPTVAQSVEQKAKQALQSRMVQEQQKQQGLQALAQQATPGQIPENVPQPQTQPGAQGLDQLTSNIGKFAGGGIVAFEDGGDVQANPQDERTKAIVDKIKAAIFERINEMRLSGKYPQKSAMGLGTQDQATMAPDFAGGGIVAFPDGGEVVSNETLEAEKAKDILRRMQERTAESPEEESGILKALKFIGNTGVNALKHALNYPGTGLSTLLNKQETPAPRQPVPGEVAPEEMAGFDRAAAEYMARRAAPETRTEPPAPPRAAPPAAAPAGLPAAVKPPAAPIQPQGIMDEEERQKNLDIIRKRRDLDPAERERVMRERLEKEVGAPDVSSLESLAQEIADRRRKMTERADPLRDMLRGIALSPRGERWMFSGARGAEYADRVQAEREAKDFELAQKMFETQAKISDVKRGWKKDVFTIGREEFNTTYKDAFDAAKEMGKSDDAARKMAQEAVLEREKMANQLAAARISAGPQLAAGARIDRAIADLMKNNPEMSYAEAYEAVTKPGGYLSPNKQTLAELKALQASLKDLADPNKNMDQELQKDAARQLAIINAKIAEMAGVDIGNPSVPPPGAVRLKPKQ